MDSIVVGVTPAGGEHTIDSGMRPAVRIISITDCPHCRANEPRFHARRIRDRPVDRRVSGRRSPLSGSMLNGGAVIGQADS
ncbi:hypothetical protein [Methanoculleus oceani]|uniref:hypothetical protein n=1 Tax=Methanoculleus oceani TaxID=2184756 RepID=UPI0020336815|nr:hypothetical protein [Methanoculleus sp. CWC-02]